MEPPKKQSRTKRKTTYKNADNKPPIELVPKSVKQGEYIDALKDSSQIIVLGPAGTGKTYIGATKAAQLYQEKQIDKIEVISVAPIIADALSAVFDDTSVSEIFGGENQA